MTTYPRDYRLSFGDHAIEGLEVPEEPTPAPYLRHIEFAVSRPWRERLFSWPWRPHHNVTVTRCLAWVEVSKAEPAWDVRPEGEVTEFTARRSERTEHEEG